MSRYALCMLLLVTGVALADAPPAAGQEAGTAGAPARTDTAPATAPPRTADTPPPEGAQQPAGEAPAETSEAPAETSEASAETSEAPEEATLIAVPGGTALGMSILGNQEAPTSLVIVPWKSSDLGESLGISPLLDDSRQPVDRDVFMRALRYYEIRSETK